VVRGLRLGVSLLAALSLGPAAVAATVNGARAWSGPDGTRIVFELSGPVQHKVFALENPSRVVVDLSRSQAAGGLTLVGSQDVVTALRAGPRDGGELRLVLELTRSAEPKAFTLSPGDGAGHRLVIDLPGLASVATAAQAAPMMPTSLGGASAAAAKPTVAPVASPPQPVRRPPQSSYANGRDVVVVIDAGHGGTDPGAIGRGGGREKDVVLAIARRLASEVNAEEGMRAVLVRDGDYLVSHRKRMQIAHDAKADFFISIHADAHRDSKAKGATVYVLSEKGATDEASLLLARRENGEDLLGGVSLADKDQMLARVLLDLSQSAALSASTAAGQRLIRRMAAVTTMRKLEVQRAPFLVLKSPDIPSVLVETAYISNPREESALRSVSYQASLATALRQGIVDYFVANPPEGSAFAGGAAPRAPASGPVRHVIVRGDTLSGIAQRYRVSSATIRSSNGLRSDILRVGQVLTIPRG
jgi:N-acetylmuramoyl-L-alanine amidase